MNDARLPKRRKLITFDKDINLAKYAESFGLNDEEEKPESRLEKNTKNNSYINALLKNPKKIELNTRNYKYILKIN
jgi:hypothetical protein